MLVLPSLELPYDSSLVHAPLIELLLSHVLQSDHFDDVVELVPSNWILSLVSVAQQLS